MARLATPQDALQDGVADSVLVIGTPHRQKSAKSPPSQSATAPPSTAPKPEQDDKA